MVRTRQGAMVDLSPARDRRLVEIGDKGCCDVAVAKINYPSLKHTR
jgi:hypothetical protein